MSQTTEDKTNVYKDADVKPLAVDIAVRGTRRLRRWFTKGAQKGLDVAEKVGPKFRVGFLLIANLAWLFAACYVSLQFFSYVLAVNPLLFWVLIAGFVLQFGTAGYLKKNLRELLVPNEEIDPALS